MDSERLTNPEATDDPCVCGAPLVKCDYCGDDRCLSCDPYDEPEHERKWHRVIVERGGG